MPIEDVKDMTWAEFLLRSFQYWEDRKNREMLFREVAYWQYCNLFTFSKQSPKSKEQFWKIGNNTSKLTPEAISAYREAVEDYFKNKKDGD